MTSFNNPKKFTNAELNYIEHIGYKISPKSENFKLELFTTTNSDSVLFEKKKIGMKILDNHQSQNIIILNKLVNVDGVVKL